jgi:hypothetical protein
MMNQRRMLISTVVALVLGTAVMPMSAVADGTGAFIGGMLTSRVMTNMNQRTQAEQQQA